MSNANNSPYIDFKLLHPFHPYNYDDFFIIEKGLSYDEVCKIVEYKLRFPTMWSIVVVQLLTMTDFIKIVGDTIYRYITPVKVIEQITLTFHITNEDERWVKFMEYFHENAGLKIDG